MFVSENALDILEEMLTPCDPNQKLKPTTTLKSNLLLSLVKQARLVFTVKDAINEFGATDPFLGDEILSIFRNAE